MSPVRLTPLVAKLSAHPHFGRLASSVLNLAQQAWRNRDAVFPRPGSPTLLGSGKLGSEALQIDGLDLSETMQLGAKSSEELDALTALTLFGATAIWPDNPNDGIELAQSMLWLETCSGLRCLGAAAAVLNGTQQRKLAEALLRLVELEVQAGAPRSRTVSPAELLIAQAWLTTCTAPECSELAQRARQLDLTRISPWCPELDADQAVRGDLGPRPRHPLTIALLAVTGILFLDRAARALGRLVLLRRTPTSLWLSERGLELFSRHEMLGRVLKERRLLVPIENIRTVEREVRFPRIGLHAGLLALGLGTLLGIRLFVDGLRVAGLSFPLIGIGLALVLFGVVLDLVFSGLGDSMRGCCRLVVTTHHGRGWAIGALEPNDVDRLLTELSTRMAARRV